MKKLFSLFAFLLSLSLNAQTNCTCDTASADTNVIYAPYSFHFDGYNSRTVNFGDINILDGGVFSVRITLRKLINTQTLNRVVWSKWGNTGNQRSAELLINTANKLNFRTSANGTSSTSATGSTVLTDNEWGYDIIVVYNKNGATNNDKVKIYINGVAETITFSGTLGAIYNSTSSLIIGLEGAGTTFDQLNAFVNTFSVTSDVITSTEADSLYNNGNPLLTESICDNIVLLPDFETASFGGTNWSIPDSSGNGYTATTSLMDSVGRTRQNFYARKIPLVIALFGQSNQLGNAANSGLSALYKEKRADVKMWQGISFVDLTTSTNTFPQINTGLHAAEFAHGWLLADAIGRDIYFVKYAIGGTSMYNYWKYGAPYYDTAVKTLDSVICYLEGLNQEYDLFIDYNQGEHDSQDATKSGAYYGLYSEQIDSLVSHYPCLKGYLDSYTRSSLGTGYSYAPTVHNSQDSLITGKSDPLFIGLDIDDLNPGVLHMNAAGYKENGIRKARRYAWWF